MLISKMVKIRTKLSPSLVVPIENYLNIISHLLHEVSDSSKYRREWQCFSLGISISLGWRYNVSLQKRMIKWSKSLEKRITLNYSGWWSLSGNTATLPRTTRSFRLLKSFPYTSSCIDMKLAFRMLGLSNWLRPRLNHPLLCLKISLSY